MLSSRKSGSGRRRRSNECERSSDKSTIPDQLRTSLIAPMCRRWRRENISGRFIDAGEMTTSQERQTTLYRRVEIAIVIEHSRSLLAERTPVEIATGIADMNAKYGSGARHPKSLPVNWISTSICLSLIYTTRQHDRPSLPGSLRCVVSSRSIALRSNDTVPPAGHNLSSVVDTHPDGLSLGARKIKWMVSETDPTTKIIQITTTTN